MILYNDDNDDTDLRLASPCIGRPLRSTAASTQLSLNWTGQVLMIMMMMMIMMPMIITQTKVGDAGMRAADAGNLCAGISLVGFPN